MKKMILWVWVLLGVMAMAQPGKEYTSLKGVKDPLMVYELKLSFDKLKSVPEEIREMKNLEVLDLSKNFIDSVPEWIGELKGLKVLILSRNWLHYLPESLGALERLELLDVNRNPLQELPNSIGNLLNLKELVLWQTGIVDLPPSIVAIAESLEELDLRVCQLTKEDQDAIKLLLPEVHIMWDQACNCNH